MMAQGGEQLGPDADSQMGIQLGFTEWPALVGHQAKHWGTTERANWDAN